MKAARSSSESTRRQCGLKKNTRLTCEVLIPPVTSIQCVNRADRGNDLVPSEYQVTRQA